MNQVKFKTRLIATAGEVIFGTQESSTDNDSTNSRLEQMNIHKVDLTSAGAGVATITFDSGNGFNGPETQSAGTIASYFIPNAKAIKITIATADTNVVLESSKQ